MKALVTGGAGYVGSHTVQALQHAGWNVVVYDNLARGHAKSVTCPLIQGELEDTPLLTQTFKAGRFDAVFHFAAYARAGESYEDPSLYFRHNVAGALSLVDTMLAHGVNKLIFSSTAALYGTPEHLPVTEASPLIPENPYGESKLMVERILHWYEQSHKLKSVSLRYFNAAGAALDGSIGEAHDLETHLLPNLCRVALGQLPEIPLLGTDYPTPDGSGIRDYIHVVDLASAHLVAFDHLKAGGATSAYNVCSGKGYSVREAIAAVERVSGHTLKTTVQARRLGDPAAIYGDSSKLQRDLGWRPRHSDLDTIVNSAWRWHSTHPYGFR